MKGKKKILSPLLAPLLAIALMLSLVAGGLTAIITSPAPAPAANGPELSVEIISPETTEIDEYIGFTMLDGVGECAVVDVSQNFEVRAIVTNIGDDIAYDVDAWIEYSGNEMEWVAGGHHPYPHEQDLGDIDPGCSVEVAWTMHCKNAGYTEVWVSADDADGAAEATDVIDVYQMIKVEITTPDIYCPGYEVCPSQTFTVKAEVTNTGVDTVNVTGILLSAFDAEITAGPSPDPEPDGILLESYELQTFTWTLHCTDRSDDTITVFVGGGVPGRPTTIIGYGLYAYHQRGLLVDIVLPSDGEMFCSCEDFYVNAVITNTCDDTIYFVWAEIGWEGPVELGEGETSRFKEIGNIAGKTSADVWWELHCNGTGEAAIMVSANGTTAFGMEVYDCDSVLVWQDVLLEVEIIEPPFVLPDGSIKPPDGYTVCECENFVVKANVTNIGCEDAYNVYGHIEIGAGAILIDEDYSYIGDLAVGDTACVTWNLHCNQSGVDVPITVYATSSTSGLNLNDTVIVRQGEDEPTLEVVLVNPITCDEFCTYCYNEFTVDAIISNPACALVENAFATLHYSCGPGDVSILSPFTQPLGDIGNLTTTMVSWDVACTGAGDVTFWVEAWADNVDPEESNNVTIHQKDFIVEITDVGGIDPAPLTVSTCQEFTITARFINCHERTQLVNIQAILDYSEVGAVPAAGSDVVIKYCTDACNETECTNGDMEYIPVEDTLLDVPPFRSMVELDRIAPCCCADVTWTLQCVGAIDGELTVTALTSGGIFLDDDTTAVTGYFVAFGGEGFVQTTCCYDLDDGYCTTDLMVTVTGWNMGIPDGTYCVEVLEEGAIFEGQATVAGNNMTVSGVLYAGLGVPYLPFAIVNGTFIIEDGILYADVRVDIDGVEELEFGGFFSSICQEWKPHLVAGLEAFPGAIDLASPKTDTFVTMADDVFGTCQDFTVVVSVTNIGQAAAEDVSVTINVAGPVSPSGEMTKTIDYIPGGESGKVWWTLHCDGVGDVTIEITEISGVDANTNKPIPEDNIDILTWLTVHQVITDLSVVITQPETCENFAYSTEFPVNALITNDGDVVIYGIWAYLYYTHATASLLTDNPVYVGDLDPDLSAPVSWMLHCDAAGDVVLQVKANSTAPAMEAYSNTVTVHQWTWTWTCIYQDPCAGTELRVNTDNKTFQFTAPDGYDSGVVEADCMVVLDFPSGRFIFISHGDSEISLFAFAVGCENGFCIAFATDMQTGERYWLFAPPG